MRKSRLPAEWSPCMYVQSWIRVNAVLLVRGPSLVRWKIVCRCPETRWGSHFNAAPISACLHLSAV